MKKFSKLLSFVALLAMTLIAPNVYAEGNVAQIVDGDSYNDLASALSAANGNSTIQLLDNVTLDSTFNVTSDKNITLDLNGHKITGPTDGKGYAIENHGTLTIKDSGETKGQIYCANRNNSCVANKSDATKMTIDGVAIASDFIAVKNESNALEIKNSTIEVYFKMYEDKSSNVGAVAIENYGTATIEETTIKAPTVFSNWTSIWTLTASSPATTTVKNVTVTGNGHIYVGQPEDEEGQTPKSTLIIEGLTTPRSTSFNSYASAFVEPDAATTEKVVKRANSGASIVIPEDYEGEIPNKTGVKYVTKEGTEVVYVTFNGVRYEVKKDEKWSDSNLETASEGLKALKTALTPKDETKGTFKRFVDVTTGETVNGATKLDKNMELVGIYEATVTFDGVEYKIEYRQNEGFALGDAKYGKTTLREAMATKGEEKEFFIYGLDENGNGTLVTAETKVAMGTITVYIRADYSKLTPLLEQYEEFEQYADMYLEDRWNALKEAVEAVDNLYVTDDWQITVDQWVQAIENAFTGLLEKSADYTEVDAALSKVENLNEKYYTEESWNQLQEAVDSVVRDKKISQQSEVTAMAQAIEEAIEKLVIKSITLTFTDSEGNTWSVVVPAGTSLEGLKSLEHAILSAEELKNVENKIFAGFVNAVTGEEIAEDEELTEDTTIKAVYNVRITFTDSEGNTWSVIVPEGTSLERLKSLEHAILSAEELKNVENKIFAGFVNAEAGEEISEDQAITENISVKAIYNVKITFTDSEGNTWSVIVPEGTSLEGLKSLEHAILSAEELKNVEGKIFKGFVNAETGEAISEDQAITENISVKAIYEEEKVEEPPVEEEPQPPVEQETQPPVENPSTYDGVMTSVLFAIISFISVVAGAVTLKKSFNVNE